MSDLIYRQDAVTIPVMPKRYRHYMSLNLDDVYEQGWEDLQLCIEHFPSAQLQRKKGKWIDYTDEGYVECPFCHSATNCDGNKDELHFCFSCGADMRGKQDEVD